MEKLVLIDGNSLLNRAFYATPAFTTKDGQPTNGVFGFVKLLLKIISDKKPEYLVVAFDLRAPTFRHKIYSDYKAGRKPMPDDLASQFPILKEVLKIMNIKICEIAGYEADDIIGTIAKRFDIQTYIYTGDRDSYQLVDENTNVCFTKKGVSELLELTQENFYKEIGLTPAQIIEYKALMGDKSDNIPGVAGVGEKSAMTLLAEYKDVDGIYANIDNIKGALQAKLINGKESAYFSKTLATIDTNVPMDISLADCIIKTPFPHLLREKFAELEFKSLITKNIFAQTNEFESNTAIENMPISNVEHNIEEVFPQTIKEAIVVVESAQSNIFAVHWQGDFFRFFVAKPTEKREYVLPIKIGLLDVGFFEDQFLPLLRILFAKKNKIIAYNIKDIMHRLEFYDVEFEAEYEDISLLKCVSEGLGNTDSLDFCINYYALPEKNKAYALSYLYAQYFQALNAEERKLYKDVELPLIRVLFDMEKQGVCIDLVFLEELSRRYNKELKEIVEKIYELAGEEFNINSTKQLGQILFEKLKIGTGAKKTKESKNYKTTAEELEKYADDYEIVRYLLRYRKIQKINSTYIEGFKPLIKNGKVHTTYNQSNTQTGRLSSVNPNLQNIPIRTEEGRELRKLFMASDGNVLIDADYSQIELRLLAHFSGCKELIEAYRDGKDIHATTAAQVFELPLSQITAELRRAAKAVNFGIIYGISAFGLANDLHISTKKAQEYIDKYFESYSEVKNYMQNNVENAKIKGCVETLLGRRRIINELNSSNYNVRSFGERAAMNMPLQGSSADIIKIAMINVSKRLKAENFKAKLVLQVHDELVIDCPLEEVALVSEILRNEMENAVTLQVPLTVDIGIGDNWFTTK